MQVHHVNLLAVLAAAVAAMVVGFVWYSPILFAKPWVRVMGYDPDDKVSMDAMKKNAGPAYFGSFLCSLLTAYVLGLFFHWLRVSNVEYGLIVAFHVWAGFVATVQLTGVLFMRQSAKLFAMNTGYQLVSYLAMGAVLAAWR